MELFRIDDRDIGIAYGLGNSKFIFLKSFLARFDMNPSQGAYFPFPIYDMKFISFLFKIKTVTNL